MIHDVDESLRRLLVGELPRLNPRYQQTSVRVTFDAPADAENDGDKSARVNLFLHDVRENRALRSDEAPLRSGKPGPQNEAVPLVETLGGDTVGLRRPPVRLNLGYLATVYGPTVADEHQLLTDVLGVFLRSPVLPTAYLAPALADDTDTRKNGIPLSVVQAEHGAHADPAGLWRALGGKLRPTLGVTALATFNPFETRWTRRVREIVFGMGQGTPERGDGPRQPLDLSHIRVSAAGVVTHEDGQTPIVGARVWIPELPGATVRTDARGFWALLDLPPGEHKVLFEATGRSGREETVDAPPPGRSDRVPLLAIALPPASPEEKRAEAARLLASVPDPDGEAGGPVLDDRQVRVSVSGTLRYPDGQPAALVGVRWGHRRATTDRDGFYFFTGGPNGVETGTEPIYADIPGSGEVEVPGNDVHRPHQVTKPLTTTNVADAASASASDPRHREKETKRIK